MKLQIRKAQTTVGDKTFVDDDAVEMNWTHGTEGCLYVVSRNLGLKGLIKAARDGKQDFKKYLKGKENGK